MSGHCDTLSLFASEDIVAAIAFVVNVLGTHKGPYAAVLIVLLQALPVVRLIVI